MQVVPVGPANGSCGTAAHRRGAGDRCATSPPTRSGTGPRAKPPWPRASGPAGRSPSLPPPAWCSAPSPTTTGDRREPDARGRPDRRDREPPRRDRHRALPERRGAGPVHPAARSRCWRRCRWASGWWDRAGGSCTATPRGSSSGAARATSASTGFDQFKGWWVESGRPIAPEEWAATRAVRQRRDLAQRADPDRGLRRLGAGDPQLRGARSPAPAAPSKARSSSTRT